MRFCIRGYDVEFPHQPYGVQFSFMEKMLRTLDEQGNALLEAPTGCGKTLSLLCAALAWQTRRKKEIFDLNTAKLTRSGVHGDETERQQRRAGVGKAPGGKAAAGAGTGAAYGPAAAAPDDEKEQNEDDDFKPTRTSRPRVKKQSKGVKAASDPSPSSTSSPAAAATNGGAYFSPASGGSRSDLTGGDGDDLDSLAGLDFIDDDYEQQPPKLPKIFFATRTHSQIAQVVRELKRSGYKPSMAILAAKQHYCINKAVKKTGRVDEECERLLKEEAHGCRFRAGKGASRGGRPPPDVGVHDIEELSTACSRAKQCPYFAARDLALTADLVFCPYSYLLDPLVRAALDLDVGGSVLIFDEAHNMEDVCREGGSMDLDLDVLREVEASFRLAAQLTHRPELYEPLAEAVGRLGALLGRFEASTEGMKPAGFEEHEAVWQGPRALALLDEAGLGPGAVPELYRLYEQAKAFEEKATFATEGDAANEAIPASVTRPGAGGAALGTLGRLLTVLRLMYAPAPPPPQPHPMPPKPHPQPHPHLHQLQRQQHPHPQLYLQPGTAAAAATGPFQAASSAAAAAATGGGFIPSGSSGASGFIPSGGGGSGGFIPSAGAGGGAGRAPAGRSGAAPNGLRCLQAPRDNSGDYRVVVKRWIAHGAKDRRKARSRLRRDDDSGAAVAPGAAVSLGLWCFNPAVAFRNLADKAHSVVLTSGTLSPLDSFASELGTEFHTRLEAPHVVDMSRQVWAGVVPRGPGGTLLSATYRESGTFAFQDDAGEAVLRYCQVIPDGLLLFMPSYGLLEKLMTRWKSTGLWARLEGAKTVVIEPREAGRSFEDAMARYYDAVRSGKGGLFLAVCRGKASEGIDFADQHARGVILLGIPFPAIMDTRVKLKKEYNDAGSGPSSGRPASQRLLSGDAWYNQQAFRALNQAVGRCIRHKYDWGAIILLDERFRGGNRQQQLSRWVRTAVKVHDDFNRSVSELEAFCKGLMADPPKPPAPPAPAHCPADASRSGVGIGNTAAAATSELQQPGAATGPAQRGTCTGAAVSTAEKAESSLQQRNRKSGGKGSVELQYEEDVVPPCEVGAAGGKSCEGPFDRFRLPSRTSPPEGRKAAVAAGGYARPITSFFPPTATGAVQQQQLQQKLAELGPAGATAVAAMGGCCGGRDDDASAVGSYGSSACGPGGGGSWAGFGNGPQGAAGLRPYGSREPPQHTQPATQQYHPPRPGCCEGPVVGASRSAGHAAPPTHPHQQDWQQTRHDRQARHQAEYPGLPPEHQRHPQPPQAAADADIPQLPQYQYQPQPQHQPQNQYQYRQPQGPQQLQGHQQQYNPHMQTHGEEERVGPMGAPRPGDTVGAGVSATGGMGRPGVAAPPEAVRSPAAQPGEALNPGDCSPAVQLSFLQSPQLAQPVPYGLAATPPLGHWAGGLQAWDLDPLQQQQRPAHALQQLQLQTQMQPMQPPLHVQQQQYPPFHQVRQQQSQYSGAGPGHQQQSWKGQPSAGYTPQRWQGGDLSHPPPPPQQQQQHLQQNWQGQAQRGPPQQEQQQQGQQQSSQHPCYWKGQHYLQQSQQVHGQQQQQMQPTQCHSRGQQTQQQNLHQRHHPYNHQSHQTQQKTLPHPGQQLQSQWPGRPAQQPSGQPHELRGPLCAPLHLCGPSGGAPTAPVPPSPAPVAAQQAGGSCTWQPQQGAPPLQRAAGPPCPRGQGQCHAQPQHHSSLQQQQPQQQQQHWFNRQQWQQWQQQQPPPEQRGVAFCTGSGRLETRPDRTGAQAALQDGRQQPPQHHQSHPRSCAHDAVHQQQEQLGSELPGGAGETSSGGGGGGLRLVDAALRRRDCFTGTTDASDHGVVSKGINGGPQQWGAAAARPTKRLTSGRAREAAMKRQRMQRANGAGNAVSDDADGSGWEDFGDDAGDFVSQ